MDSSKFLILGAYGQLGRALCSKFPNAKALDSDQLDITDIEALKKYDWSRVAVIINAAAYTNVDGAETAEGRETAWRVNAQGPGNLASIATENNITLVHISSEYVFDGTKSPHLENEPLTPLGVYAQSKAAGDIAVAVTPKHYILRVSWLIGDGKNFVRTMMGVANKGIEPKVVDDQTGRLTFTTTVVDAIKHLLDAGAAFGTYNLSNEGPEASWAEVTRTIFHIMGRDGLKVTSITSEAYFKNHPVSATRPLKSSLDLRKIKATGLEIPEWSEMLKKYVEELL